MEYTRTIPCVVKFTHNPAEKASTTEPGVAEEFEILSLELDGIDILPHTSSTIDNFLYKILKENSDD